MKTILKLPLFIILVQTIALSAFAQKLPNKQVVSVRLPANVKIDGKTTEWDNKLQAYNHAVEAYYTIANDDKNLYLAIQATYPAIIRKIIDGGISFSILPSLPKDNVITITYPVFEPNNKPVLEMSKDFFEHRPTNSIVTDSVVLINNHRLEEKSKLIMVTGIKGIDSLISVYNDNNIKVAEKFDHQMAYTYELMVPLADLGFSTDHPVKFKYHIVFNGISLFNKLSKPGTLSPDNDGVIEAKLAMEAQTTAPTDFFGEYTLAEN
jgi:hypothetical protein